MVFKLKTWSDTFAFISPALGYLNSELKGYNRDKALEQTKEIYNTTLDILNKSKEEGITSYSAALKIAKNRIEAKKL